jgi:formylglycine-generating enzyme required for sulfatase activity
MIPGIRTSRNLNFPLGQVSDTSSFVNVTFSPARWWWLAAVVSLAAAPDGFNAEARKTTNAPPAATAKPAPASPEEQLLALFKKEDNVTNTLGTLMVWVPAGYRVAKTEVTQAEYEAVMGVNPSRFAAPLHPVEQVSWDDAVQFCRRLTEKEQKDGKLPKTYLYTLPTEQEWEFYADETPLKDGITSYLGDRRNPENVGQLPANRYGLHDVRGNVWEWCSTPVARGGSWRTFEDYLDLKFRYVGTPELKYDDIGFRPVLKKSG